jgi:predicted CopG family antitoxin
MGKEDKDKPRKVKIELDEDIVNELIKMKKVGDTYSDIIRGMIGAK